MMKCEKHPDIDAEGNCSICSKPVCAECVHETIDAGIICIDCAMGQYTSQQREKYQQAMVMEAEMAAPGFWQKPPFQIGVIAVCAIAIYAILMSGSMGSKVPPYTASSSQDVSDYCLGVLSNAARLVDDGSSLNEEDISGACKLPLLVTQTADELIVTTPGKHEYGFTEARIDRDDMSLTVR